MVLLILSITLNFDETFIFNGGISSSMDVGIYKKYVDFSVGVAYLVNSHNNLYLMGIDGKISYHKGIYIEYGGGI